nr:AlpA family phage regulatory protein [Thaumasiovibrio subtropicus]
MKDVQEMTGLSRATINRLRKEGSFPPHINLGARAVGWFEHAITEWLQARMSGQTLSYGEEC